MVLFFYFFFQYKKWCTDVDAGDVPDDLREKVQTESSLYSTSSSEPCPEEIIDFSNEDFGRDVMDAHKEDT